MVNRRIPNETLKKDEIEWQKSQELIKECKELVGFNLTWIEEIRHLKNFVMDYGHYFSFSDIKRTYMEIKQKIKQKEKEERRKRLESFIAVFNNSTDYLKIMKEFIKTNPIYYDDFKLWWAWDKELNCWKKVDEVDLMNLVDEAFEVSNTTNINIKRNIIEALKRVSRKYRPKDTPKTWIQFKDCIIDLDTGDKFKPNPNYFCLNPIPWNLGTSEETPNIDKLFKEWVGKEYVETLYEITAYSLIPKYFLHRVFCLIGSGMNGKSKYLELLARFVGDNNVCSTELDRLLDSKFEIAKLHKKLICLIGETNFAAIEKSSLLKRASGEDRISIEYKNKDPFDDYNYAKIITATNTLPTTKDRTDGFYRRWLILDFPNRFSEKRDVLEDISEEEYQNLALKSIKFLKQLIKNKSFTNEGNIKMKRQRYEERSDPLSKFLKLHTVPAIDGFIFVTEFSNRFRIWLNQNGYRMLNWREISGLMQDRFERKQKGPDKWWSYIGISWGKAFKENNVSNTSKVTLPLDSIYRSEGGKRVTPITCVTSKKKLNPVWSSDSMELPIIRPFFEKAERENIKYLTTEQLLKIYENTEFKSFSHQRIKWLISNGYIVEISKGKYIRV